MNPRHSFATAALLAAVFVEPGVVPGAATAPALDSGALAASTTLVAPSPPMDLPPEAPPSPRIITLSTPVSGTQISSPVAVTGATTFYPPEATLVGHVRDADGTLLGEAPLTVRSPEIGQGGPFDGVIPFTPPWRAQDGTLEIMEISLKDGSIVTIQRTPVRLTAAWPAWPTFPIEAPSARNE